VLKRETKLGEEKGRGKGSFLKRKKIAGKGRKEARKGEK
jgi:hypothetical protein